MWMIYYPFTTQEVCEATGKSIAELRFAIRKETLKEGIFNEFRSAPLPGYHSFFDVIDFIVTSRKTGDNDAAHDRFWQEFMDALAREIEYCEEQTDDCDPCSGLTVSSSRERVFLNAIENLESELSLCGARETFTISKTLLALRIMGQKLIRISVRPNDPARRKPHFFNSVILDRSNAQDARNRRAIPWNHRSDLRFVPFHVNNRTT